MSDNKENIIYFPVDQGEQARQPKAENLLARDVYASIADFLEESLAKLPVDTRMVELDDFRAHDTILIDGGRGTGKSTILVNLSTYMDSRDALRDKLLILKPVDPTLLENDDDLFLNIIVAALLRDKQVKAAIAQPNAKSTAFFEQLQALGNTLEGTQKQKEQYGLDKLRAFIGNHSVADEVHKLFYCALQMTGKHMIVFPIDDVDTSLQHAFSNLEVLRKYMATPYVLPIISGDRALYAEVTWRNFYNRMTFGISQESSEAVVRSKELTAEYQRKIFPTQRRQIVPDFSEHLTNENIVLSGPDNKHYMTIVLFKEWLTFVLNERINGTEESKLSFPAHSVREFSQLTHTLQKQIISLSNYFRNREISSRDYINVFQLSQSEEFRKLYSEWFNPLQTYFSHDAKFGAQYLIMATNSAWWNLEQKNNKSLLSTALFQPLTHSSPELKKFCNVFGLRKNWSAHLTKVKDDAWKENLPDSTVLPYPLPEIGIQGQRSLSSEDTIANIKTDEKCFKTELIKRLFVHQISYSTGSGECFIFTGRLFELLVLSVMRDVTMADVAGILDSVPYYSVSSFSGTKLIEVESTDEDVDPKVTDHFAQENLIYLAGRLVEMINDWRKKHFNENSVKPGAWFIYKVMNKYFTQLSVPKSWILYRPKASSKPSIDYLADIGLRAFYAICAAFGSFEIPLKNSKNVLNPEQGFKRFRATKLFNATIQPFLLSQKNMNKVSKLPAFVSLDHPANITGPLYQHPLRALLEEVAGVNE